VSTDPQNRLPRAPGPNALERQNLLVTIASTVVAVAAAVAAFWSSYEAHKARIDDERPTLIANIVSRLTPTYPFKRIEVENIGKSPAMKIQVYCKTMFESDNGESTWRPEDMQGTKDTFAYLYPGIFVDVNCPQAASYTPGAAGAVVQLGIIQYQGSRGDSYQSPFCYTFQLSGPQIDPTHLDVHQCGDSRNLPPPN
jgi:hypothetical protein